MAAIRELLSPVIVCLLFIRGLRPLPTTALVTGAPPTRPPKPHDSASKDIVLPPDSYYEDEDPVTTALPEAKSPVARTRNRCDYSLCLENQTPCLELAAATGCLCPGITLHNTPPLAPTLTSVSPNGSEVVLRWCAPLSHVTSYVVTVGGERRQVFGRGRRSGAVGAVDHVSEVCVSAVNEAGGSKSSCEMYYPRTRSLPLTAGLVGGALGLLLLVLLAVLLWRRRKQRKQQASISAHNAVEPL